MARKRARQNGAGRNDGPKPTEGGAAKKSSLPPSAAETRNERRRREREQRPERGGKPDARPLLSGDWPHRYLRVALLLGAMLTIAAVRATPMFSEPAEARVDLRWQAPDGREYPYLIGQDSYSWVRKAKNYLATGSPCDEVVEGVCRDTMRHAPVGSEMPYAESLHIRAIAWFHRAVTVFRPATPIEVSAFFLQVLVGALGAIPAWFIGRRLGGAWGGFASALLVGLHANFFERSLGADNDTWNVVLPMCAVWAAIEAVDRRVLWQRAACGALAGVAIGLHADVWSGFGLGFLVVFVGLLGMLGWTASRAWRVDERPAIKQQLVALALVLASVLGGALAFSHEYHEEWNGIASKLGLPQPWSMPADSAPVGSDSDTLRAPFPYGLHNVGELRKLSPGDLMDRFGGSAMLFGAFLGVFILLLPFGAWGTLEVGLLALATAAIGAAVFVVKASPWGVAASATVPALWLLGARVLSRQPPTAAPIAGALFLGVWLLATMKLSMTGQRFVLLAVPPLGLAVGCGAGHLIHHVRRHSRTAATSWVLAALLVASVAGLSQKGVAYAKQALPSLNDAWWDAMTKLRQTSPKDSIVHTWWPYGYWVQYIAERSVTGDGASGLKRITHWTGRALMSSDERESLGLFRMISCGSDANGQSEESLGAYHRLQVAGVSSFAAHDLVLRLAPLSLADARQLLSQYPYNEAQMDAILAATHCKPRPSYLVLSDKQVRQNDLRYQGNWDPKRATIVRSLRDRPDKEAMGIMLTKLGMKGTEAVAALSHARAAKTDAQIDHYIAPAWPPYTMTQCTKTGEGRSCRIVPRKGQSSPFATFEYQDAAPERGVFTYSDKGTSKRQPPDAIVVVRPTGMQTYENPGGGAKDYSVLVDTPNGPGGQVGQVVVASSSLVRSIFTRLIFLTRYPMRGFERVDDRRAGGERVLTFRLHFPEDGQR